MARIYRRTVQKNFHNPDNYDGVITHLGPDILECEVKWALESITMNKASGGDRIPVELFQILEDDLWKCSTVRGTLIDEFEKLLWGKAIWINALGIGSLVGKESIISSSRSEKSIFFFTKQKQSCFAKHMFSTKLHMKPGVTIWNDQSSKRMEMAFQLNSHDHWFKWIPNPVCSYTVKS